ncbi:prephenate dehydratase domain-containing protein [Marinilabiliaceae bacterium ANBcel2]|nr:prephenate dehydratase domain-containing protein [Marinilabiliaceae bacterium ANBcel2]
MSGEQKKVKKVAMQGWPGANHDIAIRAFYSNYDVETVSCVSFDELFDKIDRDRSLEGIVAIENTLVGSILANYTLLKDSGLQVLGEHKLRIKHQFMVLPGQTMSDIREVHSHPMALAQCHSFLRQYPHVKLIETEDTALSAKLITDNQTEGVGAIASSLASKLYGLEVIGKNIETNKHNYTRFLIVGTPDKEKQTRRIEDGLFNKSSLVFSLPHEEGSLSKILTILTFYNINLTKIQSLPIIGSEWEYLFYIDVMFHNYDRYIQSLNAIRPLCRKLRELGVYRGADVLYETNGGENVKNVNAIS